MSIVVSSKWIKIENGSFCFVQFNRIRANSKLFDSFSLSTACFFTYTHIHIPYTTRHTYTHLCLTACALRRNLQAAAFHHHSVIIFFLWTWKLRGKGKKRRASVVQVSSFILPMRSKMFGETELVSSIRCILVYFIFPIEIWKNEHFKHFRRTLYVCHQFPKKFIVKNVNMHTVAHLKGAARSHKI